MKNRKGFIWGLFFVFFCCFPVLADDYDYNKAKMSFENFIRCELTRTDAVSHFNGKSFEIIMVNFYDMRAESNIKIVTGAVQCSVEKNYRTLYVALGLKQVLGKETISYYLIRPEDFTILATELIQYPYKERCTWNQFRIDIN